MGPNWLPPGGSANDTDVAGRDETLRLKGATTMLSNREHQVSAVWPELSANYPRSSRREYCPTIDQTGTFRCFLPDPTSSPGIS